MKNYPWIFLSAGLLALAFAPQACGGGTDTGGGGATTTTTSGSVTTSITTVTTGTTTALTCTDILDPTGGDCNACLDDKCCDLVTACSGDQDCVDCFNAGGSGTACDTNAPWTTLKTCQDTSCSVCTPKSACNPVTSAECTVAGEGCDLAQDQTYQCFGGETEALCAKCDYNTDLYCAPGLYCVADSTLVGLCARYCCADTDCGTGTCVKTDFPGGPGICLTTGDAGTMAPSCDAPKVSPSGGSCFTL